MIKAQELLLEYMDFIGPEVLTTFGAPHQTYETLRRAWRYEIPYKPEIEEFLVLKTKVFLHLLPANYRNNLNIMYQLCNKITDHLSKYIVKKDPNLSRAEIEADLMQKIFYHNHSFINKFKRSYAKIIDMNNTFFVGKNPGVIALYQSLKSRHM